MKKIIFIFALLLIISCDNGDDDKVSNTLNGKWFMKSFSCFCEENNNDLPNEYVLWSFNASENKLNIINYSDRNFIYLSSQYDYSQTENQVIINNRTFDFEIINQNLRISDDPELDGPLMTFLKTEINCTDNPLEDLDWLAAIKISLENDNVTSIITQYTYNNETVFLIPDCHLCTDALYTVYNCDGETVCQFGSIAGINTCNNWFLDNATNSIILFED